MEEKLQGLLALLEQEAEFYAHLLSLSAQEQKIIIAGKVNELDKNVKEKEKTILEIKELERLRIPIFEDLSKELNIDVKELNINKLKNLISEEYSNKLENLQEKMDKITSELRNVSENNVELIKASLDYIQFSLNLLSSNNKTITYSDNGKIEEKSESQKILDKKV